MTILQSQEFMGDRALEACATQDAAHIVPGASGPHVRKIQQALNRIDFAGIGGTEYNSMRYGQATTNAVTQFKTKRNILNYAGRIDSIVGIKTIRALDQALLDLGQGLENAVDMTQYTDVMIRFLGGSKEDKEIDALNGIVKPVNYDALGRRLKGICWGAHPELKNRVLDAYHDFMRLHDNVSIGLLCIRGNSRGGIWALEFAERLSKEGIPIHYLGLQDAGFSITEATNEPNSRIDSQITNTPLFPARQINAAIKNNWYQRAGNHAGYSIWNRRRIWKSNLNGEIHGEVPKFTNRLVSRLHPKMSDKDAHKFCCDFAEGMDCTCINDLLEKICN